MLYTIPMFFYTGLFHSRRPDLDRLSEEDNHDDHRCLDANEDGHQRQGQHQEQHLEDEDKGLLMSLSREDQDATCPERQQRRRGKTVSSDRKQRRRINDDQDDLTCSSTLRDETEQSSGHCRKDKNHKKLGHHRYSSATAEDRSSSNGSFISTGSGRIRSLQSQIHKWIGASEDDVEDDNDRLLIELQEDVMNIPPMPKIPFFSIDVRGFLEETEHSEEDYDDDENEEEPGQVDFFRGGALAVEEGGLELSNISCPQNRRYRLNEARKSGQVDPRRQIENAEDSANEEEEKSLVFWDVVQEEDTLEEEIDFLSEYDPDFDGDIYVNKPQTYLLDFLTASQRCNSTTQLSSSSSSSSPSSSASSSSSSLSSSHHSSLSESLSPSPCSVVKQSFQQRLLHTHANLDKPQQLQSSSLSHQHSVTSPFSSHEEDNKSSPVTATASTPYHVLLLTRQQQQANGRHRVHNSHINNRCLFPSQITIPRITTEQSTSTTTDRFPVSNNDKAYDERGDDNATMGNSEDREEFEILDPADPLECGKINENIFPYLRQASDRMNALLLEMSPPVSSDGNNTPSTTATTATGLVHLETVLDWITQHPMVCQVKYQLPALDSLVERSSVGLLLHYFSATGWLEGCHAAYQAFPEAIGMESSAHLGLPLHYACRVHQKDNHRVVTFLLEKFPDAARFTNQEYHQTPLHLACQSPYCRLETIQLLLEQYPTAAQLADAQGFTPLHYACQHCLPLSILQALQASGPAVMGAATKTWHKPLHLAALYGCPVNVLQWLIQSDKRAAACTLDDFSTPLHCAVLGFQKQDVTRRHDAKAKLECLIRAHPEAIHWTNAQDQTPYDLALTLLSSNQEQKPRGRDSHHDHADDEDEDVVIAAAGGGHSTEEEDNNDSVWVETILQILKPPNGSLLPL